jgi:hypothetical protein
MGGRYSWLSGNEFVPPLAVAEAGDRRYSADCGLGKMRSMISPERAARMNEQQD